VARKAEVREAGEGRVARVGTGRGKDDGMAAKVVETLTQSLTIIFATRPSFDKLVQIAGVPAAEPQLRRRTRNGTGQSRNNKRDSSRNTLIVF